MSSDAIAIGLAWTCSYVFRFLYLPGAERGVGGLFVEWSAPLVLLTLYFLSRNRLYDQTQLLTMIADVMAILKSNVFSLLTFVVLLYFGSEQKISRLTIVLYAALSTLFLIFGRLIVRSMIRKLRRKGYLTRRVLLVGTGERANLYREKVRYTPGTGLKVVAQSAALGAESHIERVLLTEKFDIVILALEASDEAFIDWFMAKFYDRLFKIQIVLDEKRSLVGMQTEEFDSLHLLTSNHPEFSLAEIFFKRLLDIVASGLGLILISPLLLIIAAAVKTTSEGPIFFAQERVGFGGGLFKMWKFRSMRSSPLGSDSTSWTVENDPRRTSLGTFLRKTSIDELPQLWNVFIGDMSLVGPRPEQPYFVEKFKDEIPAYMLRHKMRSGITGWAQVNGWRGDTSLHKRIEFDLFYIRNWSIWFDLKILLLTVVRGFINRNAY